MAFLIFFLIILVVGVIAWLKIPVFREWVAKTVTAKAPKADSKRIGDLEKLLAAEEEKTAAMLKRAEEVEATRKKLLGLKDKIKEQRKQQLAAQQKIKGEV